MQFFSISDIGKVRKKNEDSYTNYVCDEYALFVVCDGIGGHNSGELASRLACESVSEFIRQSMSDTELNLELVLSSSISYAHNKINKESLKSLRNYDMGTTIVMVLIEKDTMYFLNAGDSRIYIYSDGKLQQLSKDHSYAQELVDLGLIDENEANSISKNKITSCLGTQEDYKIYSGSVKVKIDDIILLVTDGLTDLVDDDSIKDVLSLGYDIKKTSEILTKMANSNGGNDNITITCVKVS